MAITLGGSSFVYNGISQDYSFIETFNCIYELCDQISIAYGGTDGTNEEVYNWIRSLPSPLKPIFLYPISEEEWASQQGREKLSYFSNKAIDNLTSDYNLYVQSDECVHESCANAIRQAIETDEESFFCHRLNCWASSYTVLNVSNERKPVSTHVIRLAKTKYRCVGDAESLGLMPSASPDFLNDIRIYHTGFVRDKHKHLVKIKHIQEDIFLFGEADKRIHDCVDGFDCWKFGFSPADVEPIQEKLPKFIQQWASEREVDPFKSSDEQLACDFLIRTGNLNENIIRASVTETANLIWWQWAKQHCK